MKKTGLDAVEIAEKQRHLYLLGKVKNNRHLSPSELEELKKLEGKKRDTSDERRATSKKSALAAAEVLKTQREAAKYSGVSERTVRRWVKAKMPRTEAGHYIKTMLDFYKENEGSKPTEAKSRKEEASADKTEAQAKTLLWELEIKQGKLVYIDEYIQDEVKRHVAINRALRFLPRIMAARMPEKYRRKVQAIAKEEIEKILDAFAEGRPQGKNKG